jgi:F0F1-type ATP synthase epsilon subunit
MATPELTLRVRTPRGIAFEASVRSLRVPTDSGQVGLRPRSEAASLGVVPGIILVREIDAERYLASAGGLLRCDGREALLLTPVAVAAESAAAVRDALDAALSGARADLEVRRLLERLEHGIVQQLRRANRDGTP